MKSSSKQILEYAEDSPIIAAVKDFEDLEKCKNTDCRIVFILFGNICNIIEIVDKIKAMGKCAIVHVDLISGLGSKEVAVDYIKNFTKADGIISTKPALIKRANELSLFTIQRFFLIDSMAYNNVKNQIDLYNPDVIEVLPGSLHKVIEILCKEIRTPLIAGGLIMDKEDVISALKAGAIAVSTSHQDIWFM